MGVHIGFYGARSNAVHPYSGRAKLFCHRFGIPYDGGFCRRIVAFAASAGNAPDGRNIHNAAVLFIQHIAQSALAAIKNSFYINSEYFFPFFIGAILKNAHNRNCGVVYKNLHRPKLALDGIKHGANLVILRNVRAVCPSADFRRRHFEAIRRQGLAVLADDG